MGKTELLDTFDINGRFLGVKMREFCHTKDPKCYHNAVWISILNDRGEILVQKRAKCKREEGGKWSDTAVAGHVDAGETFLQTCVRETKEELGIRARQKDFEFVTSYLNKAGFEFGQIFILRKNILLSQIRLQQDEVEEVKYLAYKDFKKLLYSDDFCNEPEDYKQLILKIVKDQNKSRP